VPRPDRNGCDGCTNNGADGSGGDPANDGSVAHGICDASDDTDTDGLTDAHDICPDTPPGTAVDRETACPIAQLVPCAGPFGSSEPWQDHGQYVASVTQTAQDFVERRLMTPGRIAPWSWRRGSLSVATPREGRLRPLRVARAMSRQAPATGNLAVATAGSKLRRPLPIRD